MKMRRKRMKKRTSMRKMEDVEEREEEEGWRRAIEWAHWKRKKMRRQGMRMREEVHRD
jgi:hypothetical protein